MRRFAVLSGSALKWIALISMTIDHVGMMLFPRVAWLRIIGRLAFPLFAYMIAEGCRYTRSRTRYMLTMAAFAAVCQTVYAVSMQSVYLCVLVTFSLAVLFIMFYEWMWQKRRVWAFLLFASSVVSAAWLLELGKTHFSAWDFDIDYGIFGVLLPLLIYIGRTRWEKLLLCAMGLVPVCLFSSNDVQWWCFLALIPLALYNGTRGKHPMKYLFYIYYPLHLVVLYGIDMLR